MVRKKQGGSAYQQVQHQAQVVLPQIQKDIRDLEADLASLRDQEQKLESLLGGQSAGAVSTRPIARGKPSQGRTSAASGRRTDWNAALAKLPKQFKAADVRKVPGMANKRPSEIFAGIGRWINAKLVKRKGRGMYERVG
jgi:hypothetical protein